MSESIPFYTRADIAEHNNSKNNWVLIHNNVYDVTAFLNEHPGGEEVLMEMSGKDATENFEDVGHSSDAREMMKKFKIGELVAEERTNVPEKSEPDWSTEEKVNENSMKSWLVPLAIGIFATLCYKYIFNNNTNTNKQQ